MGIVEHRFGHVKHNLNHRQMSHQGLRDIETEQLLYAINYNTKRYLKLQKEENHIHNKKSVKKSLQTNLTVQKHNIHSVNNDHSNILNPKLCNNNILMKTKATIP